MKRTVSLILGILAALSVLPFAAAGAAELPVYGDADGNGICDAADVSALRTCLTGGESAVTETADLNADGQIDARDLTLLLRSLKGETAVMMVYLSGSTLESDEELQCAARDIEEMCAAQRSAGLRTVILTGGAEKWHTEYAKADENDRIEIAQEGVKSERFSEKLLNMGDAKTLGSFIQQTAAQYPADHYSLVMWGHGTGPLWGMCYDSIFRDTLTLPEFRSGLEAGGVKFDWIGIDCCLMGTVETLKAVQGYADFMVASEIRESKYGWKYDNFMTKWARNPAISPAQLAMRIADDTVEGNAGETGSVQIACYDVLQTDALLDAYYAFAAELIAALPEDNGTYYDFEMIPDFSQARYDIYDLDTMAEHILFDRKIDGRTKTVPLDSAAALREQISHTVYYNCTANMYEFGGIAVWFPRDSAEDGLRMREMLQPIGIDEAYITMMETYFDSISRIVID